MDPIAQQIGERGVHRALAGDAVLSFEGVGDDLDGEVGFAACVMAGMTAMLLAIVGDAEQPGASTAVKRLAISLPTGPSGEGVG